MVRTIITISITTIIVTVVSSRKKETVGGRTETGERNREQGDEGQEGLENAGGRQ